MEELILKEREFKEKLVELINNSNLPAFIIKPTLKELFEQLNLLEQQEYQNALKSKEVDLSAPTKSIKKKGAKDGDN